MRPSAIRRSSVSRAISRRTPSKLESRTAEGVSSMITSTPVSFSSARMLRPSRPMIRPFISSLGSSTRRVVDSLECLAAIRCIATDRMLRARRSASARVSSSICCRRRPAWWRASCSTSASSSCFACAALSPESRSSSRRWTRFDCFSSSSSLVRLRSRSSTACVRRSTSARWIASDSVSRSARSSIRAISSRRARSSAALPVPLLAAGSAAVVGAGSAERSRRQGSQSARWAIASSPRPSGGAVRYPAWRRPVRRTAAAIGHKRARECC